MKAAISMAGLTGRNRGQPGRGQPAGSRRALHDAGSGSRKRVAP